MDYKVIWDREAIAELGQVISHIAQHNPTAAHRTGEAIPRKVGGLSQFPEIGRVFQQLIRLSGREIPVPPCRIICHVNDVIHCIRILKVWHGARQEPHIQ
jgi:plasmid stabilization system protein ParE